MEEREGTIGIVGDKTKKKMMAAKSSGLSSGFVYDNYSECECMDIVQMLDETIHPFTNIQ